MAQRRSCWTRRGGNSARSLRGRLRSITLAASSACAHRLNKIKFAMGKGDYLGEFEHLVMLAIVRAGGESGGVAIHDELAGASKRSTSLPAIYVTLGRLEKKGYVRARETPAPPDRGGRPRRLFAVTRAGAAALRDTRALLERMWGT